MGVLIQSYQYTYDAAGNLVKSVEEDGRTVDYDYDLLDQIIQEMVTAPDGTTQTTEYVYDLVGNRIEKIDESGTVEYTYDSHNQLISDGMHTYEYDLNGNLTKKKFNQ